MLSGMIDPTPEALFVRDALATQDNGKNELSECAEIPSNPCALNVMIVDTELARSNSEA